MKELNSNTSLHIGLANTLRSRIIDGSLLPGQSLESENELCSKYGISRGPVRQALDTLVKERLIYRRPGKGTFISDVVKRSTGQSNNILNIGVFVEAYDEHEIQEAAFMSEMVRGFSAAASRSHPKVRLSFEFHDYTNEIVEQFLGQKDNDGFLFIPMGLECIKFLESLSPRRTQPIVSFFRPVASPHISNFYIDHEEGSFRATDYLIRQGHHRIGIVLVASIAERIDSRERHEGYRRALQENGIAYDPGLVMETGLIASEVKIALHGLLQKDSPPTALLLGGQALVNPCTKMLHASGLRIPHDISVIAFDDSTEARVHDPSLTVVKQPYSLGTQKAFERLVSEIRQTALDAVSIALKPELVIRDSCMTCKKP